MKQVFGFRAVAGLLVATAPAHAVSLANPASVATTKSASEGITTEVRWHRWHHWHRHWHHRHW